MPHTKTALIEIYERLSRHYGPTDWWPGDTPFEIAVGAVLTQNTNWGNVERAIANLKRENLLGPRKILACGDGVLEAALRPSGYFRVKARRLRSFCRYLVERYQGSMKRLAARPLEALRPELLAVDGIGPETADDILLYACEKPVFVVDAYTRRIFSRHGLCAPDIAYEPLRALFEKHLEPDLRLFREYHGLIVYTGKDFCRRTPKCDVCPLGALLTRRPA
ncbi:MAG: endonuclease III domain-containing protein [Candidatus Hydrogenedentes bacterium]|jgi:endonuclease-3 related protein|nr:endonuclease III domain-containing protein [FCB group bacterium]NLT60897.1 endonuclease III domain-containing protein [Candidatus Hydrogenedentota bacterium]HPX42542.1 endonuclease III domain-containing protein [Candidatus Hydrogenedentota bacterium]